MDEEKSERVAAGWGEVVVVLVPSGGDDVFVGGEVHGGDLRETRQQSLMILSKYHNA